MVDNKPCKKHWFAFTELEPLIIAMIRKGKKMRGCGKCGWNYFRA